MTKELDFPFAARYGSDEVRAFWTDDYKRLTWRRIWVALAEAQAQAGLVTPETARVPEAAKELGSTRQTIKQK